MLLTKGAKTMFIIVFTMILIVFTIIHIVFTKIGNVVRYLKYAWVNCYIIANVFVRSEVLEVLCPPRISSITGNTINW